MLRVTERFRRLRELVYAFALLWGYRLALWLLPFDRVTELTRRRAASAEASRREQRRLTKTIGRAAQFVPHATCLVRVLAGAHLLAARDQRAQIVIRVRKRAGTLEAHAWLEAGGQIIIGDIQDLASYHPLT